MGELAKEAADRGHAAQVPGHAHQRRRELAARVHREARPFDADQAQPERLELGGDRGVSAVREGLYEQRVRAERGDGRRGGAPAVQKRARERQGAGAGERFRHLRGGYLGVGGRV